MDRRHFLCAATASSLGLHGAVRAQAGYPTKPIKWVVQYPAGGADVVTRMIAAEVASELKGTIIVDNRPGAFGFIAAENIAKSAPDGYTAGSVDNSVLVLNTALHKKLPYDPAKDFSLISLTSKFPLNFVVHPSVQENTVPEFLESARKSNPPIAYGSVGIGSIHHLAMELIKRVTNTDLLQIPYKGAAPAVQDLLAGQIKVMILGTASAYQHYAAGKMKILGSLTKERQAKLPNVPTLIEQGIKAPEIVGWQGLVAPAGIPASVARTLSESLAKALAAPELRRKLLEIGVEPVSNSPTEFANFVRSENEIWHPLIRNLNIQLS